jgi:hypothetical protein
MAKYSFTVMSLTVLNPIYSFSELITFFIFEKLDKEVFFIFKAIKFPFYNNMAKYSFTVMSFALK